MAWVSIKLSPIQNYESSPKKVRHSELVRWLCVWGEFRGPQTSDSDGTSRKNLLPRLEPPDSQKFGESLIAWRCPSHMPPGSSARGHPGAKRHSTHQRWSRLWQPKKTQPRHVLLTAPTANQTTTAACAVHRSYDHVLEVVQGEAQADAQQLHQRQHRLTRGFGRHPTGFLNIGVL